MATILQDNAFGTLASGITAGATTLAFTSGHGARFPAVVAPDVLYCCILNTANVLEEVIITAHTADSDSCTITRAAGGTTAKVWSAGDRIEARVSKTALLSLNVASATTATSAGTAAVAAVASTASYALQLTPNSGGRIYSDDASGLFLISHSGTNYDLSVWTTASEILFFNPTGSKNLVFAGTMTSSGGFVGPIVGKLGTGTMGILTLPLYGGAGIGTASHSPSLYSPYELNVIAGTAGIVCAARVIQGGTYSLTCQLNSTLATPVTGYVFINGTVMAGGTFANTNNAAYSTHTNNVAVAVNDIVDLRISPYAGGIPCYVKNVTFRIAVTTGYIPPTPIVA
jgi:hypothetical protein